jgi:hypothetical protein
MLLIWNSNLSVLRLFQIQDFDTHCGVEGACRLHFPFFRLEISIGANAHSPKSWNILPISCSWCDLSAREEGLMAKEEPQRRMSSLRA